MFFQAILKTPTLSSKRGHVTKIMFLLGVHLIYLTVRKAFEVIHQNPLQNCCSALPTDL